mmetsp:Transcript_11277/g.31657  ORF Transcript_11277/g.31657 Transcript_11277/m.31657 type:complete len:205 (+) Transcript_11277:62-676(+)
MGAACSDISKATPAGSISDRTGMEDVAGFKSQAAKSGARKLRGALSRGLADISRLRKLLKPLYATPSDAFDDFAQGEPHISLHAFSARLEELGFHGNVQKLFALLCDSKGRISSRAFRERMFTAGRAAKIGTDGVGFAEVCELAGRAAGLAPADAVRAAVAAELVLKRASSRSKLPERQESSKKHEPSKRIRAQTRKEEQKAAA